MENVMAAATIIVPVVLGVTQVYKTTFGGKKRLPIINLAIGMIIGGLWAVSFAPDELVTFIWGGALSGMAAGGFYDLGVNLKEIAVSKGEGDR